MASKNQRKRKREIAARSATANAREQGHDATPGTGTAAPAPARRATAVTQHRRPSTETKSALKTTELAAYAATVLAIVIASLALDADGEGGRDPFGAQEALRYITWLTIGYMVSRGLAKSGSWTTHGDSRHRTDDRTRDRDVADVRTPDVPRDTHRDGDREVQVAQVTEHVEAPRAAQQDHQHETHQVPDHADQADHDVRSDPSDRSDRSDRSEHDVSAAAQGGTTGAQDDAARADGTGAVTDDVPADTGTPGVAPTQR